MNASVLKLKLASLQVCVPVEYTDDQVVEFANDASPTGLDHGWAIRREGHEHLQGDPERNACDKYSDNVHIVLDC